MNNILKKIANERINILIQHSISNAISHPSLSKRYAILARTICIKYRLKIPYLLTIIFCKQCKCFMPPGLGSKIRLGRSSIKLIRITCNNCGHIYRKILPK